MKAGTDYIAERVGDVRWGTLHARRYFKTKILFPAICLLLFSCGAGFEATIDCPADIAARAFAFAVQYRDAETEYAWGGQDALRAALRLDCSGLVVRCYGYAVEDSAYRLLFADASSADMYANYARLVELDELRQGDLIFMGESGTAQVTHIALFDHTEAGIVYFIDATKKDTDGDGIDDIDGVTARHYAANDARIKAFGIMQVLEKNR